MPHVAAIIQEVLGMHASSLESAVSWLNGIIWNPAFIWLILAVGLFYSIMTRFVQVRHLGEM